MSGDACGASYAENGEKAEEAAHKLTDQEYIPLKVQWVRDHGGFDKSEIAYTRELRLRAARGTLDRSDDDEVQDWDRRKKQDQIDAENRRVLLAQEAHKEEERRRKIAVEEQARKEELDRIKRNFPHLVTERWGTGNDLVKAITGFILTGFRGSGESFSSDIPFSLAKELLNECFPEQYAEGDTQAIAEEKQAMHDFHAFGIKLQISEG